MIISRRADRIRGMSNSPLPRSLEETVVIVGVGLIGGSLAAALKQRRVAERVIGVGRNAERLATAKSAGLIDEGFTDIAAAARQARLTVVCTPVDRIVDDVRQTAGAMPAGSLITDAGSVKGTICESLADLSTGPATFIGSHPLAGSEKQGFEHASANLFEGRLCVITPTKNSPLEQVQRLHRFWQGVGMRTEELPADRHDAALALTSHLPHAIAAVLARTLKPELAPLAATGFRDTTRIAAGDPELWTAILLQNSNAMIAALGAWEVKFAELRSALEHRDGPSLKKLLQQAKTIRDALDQPSSTPGRD